MKFLEQFIMVNTLRTEIIESGRMVEIAMVEYPWADSHEEAWKNKCWAVGTFLLVIKLYCINHILQVLLTSSNYHRWEQLSYICTSEPNNLSIGGFLSSLVSVRNTKQSPKPPKIKACFFEWFIWLTTFLVLLLQHKQLKAKFSTVTIEIKTKYLQLLKICKSWKFWNV